jgi:phytoene synthase
LNPSSAEITRKAKSNLAFALRCLPKERRRDLVTFYAFCRIIDDLADDLDRTPDERRIGLQQWHDALRAPHADEPHLAAEMRDVRDRREIDPQLLHDIIDGCESDLHPQRFGTWEDLQQYNYRVACAVGLASLPIFSANDSAREYAITLGHALQLTNIIRDIGEDLSNGVRIYLPLADLVRFQYTERDLIGRVHDSRFLALMTFQADRAEELFEKAQSLLPPDQGRALLAAEIMRRIYHTLLQRMRQDNFRVFDRRYKLSKPLKLSIMLREVICSKFSTF